MNWWPRKETSKMPDLEDISTEAAMRELAKILAAGFLGLQGSAANLGENAAAIEGQVGVTDDIANDCSSRNMPD